MNYLKKKLKPFTSGLTNTANQASGSQSKKGTNKDLEDDLYDEYVVEAPPHPSELLALGVEPTEIDVNNPDKLRELYRKALEEGKDKKVNSVLLAKQRQKEELEEKKRTREEWKFFESLTTRVEQVVKSSQKNLDQWKESSAVDQLTQPEYELHGEVPKSVLVAEKIEKHLEEVANKRINQVEEQIKSISKQREEKIGESSKDGELLDEFGCPVERRRSSVARKQPENAFVVNELLEDFGIDLRTEDQKKALERQEAKRRREVEEELQRRKLVAEKEAAAARSSATTTTTAAYQKVKTAETRPAVRARPRPRPGQSANEEVESKRKPAVEDKLDPFDTSFVAPVVAEFRSSQVEVTNRLQETGAEVEKLESNETGKDESAFVDPFDTSHVNF